MIPALRYVALTACLALVVGLLVSHAKNTHARRQAEAQTRNAWARVHELTTQVSGLQADLAACRDKLAKVPQISASTCKRWLCISSSGARFVSGNVAGKR